MQRLEIGKQLIVEEDLALEDAPVTQTRSDETVDVTPLKLFKIVKSVEELKNIDVNKFKQSVIFGAPETAEVNNVFYQWYPDNNLPEEIPFVVASDKSPTGRWVEQVFVSVATFSSNFVTLTTPQYIERGADKQWLNNNIFFGDSSFGQIVLGADEESASLKFSFVDTRGKLFQQEAFIGFDSLGDDDFVVVNNKEGGKIAFGNELSFLGDAKNINNVAVAALPHQAVPKSQLDAAKAALEQAMDSMKQGLEQQIDDLASTVQSNTESIAENSTLIAQNKQDISSNAADIVQNTTRLDELSERMDRITQTGVIIGQITKTMAEVEVDRETILDAFVMERKSREPLEGDSIYTTDSHGYYRHATAWSEPYTISIGIATTVAPGLVKSVDNTDTNRGKVKVDSSSGEMSMVKGEKLPYMDQANTFEQDNVFNKNLRVLQNLNVLGVAYAGGASVGARAPGDNLPQTEDQLLEIHSYNEQGTPSRLKGLATYNKTVDISGMYPCEIVNVDALMRYIRSNVPTDIARKTQVNEFTAVNSFSAGLRVKNNLTILDATGSSDFDKASLTVQGYVRARNSLTADKGLYAGMDHGDSDGGNALFRVTAYPEREDVATGAFYNKVIENPTDDEVVNHRWLKQYTASNSGAGATAGALKCKTFSTLTRSSAIYGYAFQEVVYDENGQITWYGDLFVRGDRMTRYCGSGQTTGLFRIPFPGDVEMDLYSFFYNFYIARPKAGQGKDNSIFVWGRNGNGQLGTGNTTDVDKATEITFPARVKDIGHLGWYGGNFASVVLLENGDVYVTGRNAEYCLGLGHANQVNTWTRSNISGVTSINCDSYLTLFARKSDGVYVVGYNVYGAGGTGNYNTITNWTKILNTSRDVKTYTGQYYSGAYRFLALHATDNSVYFAGWNVEKQCDNAGGYKNTPTLLTSSLGNIGVLDNRIYTNGVACLFLASTSSGDQIWASGYVSDISDGGGSTASATLHKSFQLEGSGWEFVQYNQHLDSARQGKTYLYNRNLRKLMGFGADMWDFSETSRNYTTAKEIPLPRAAKGCKYFEVRRFYVGSGNLSVLCVICDNEIYANGNDALGLVANTNNNLQLQFK